LEELQTKLMLIVEPTLNCG